MFAVFKNNVFVNFWLNRQTDNWLGLTIESQGWLPNEITVLWFDSVPSIDKSYFFNEQKEIVVLDSVPTQVGDEVKPVLMPGQVITGQVYYEKGQFKELNQ